MSAKNYGNGWVHQFPNEEGHYWFHGNRWERNEEIETILCEVSKAGDSSFIVTANGHFMYKSELGKKWAFKKTQLPEIPELH